MNPQLEAKQNRRFPVVSNAQLMPFGDGQAKYVEDFFVSEVDLATGQSSYHLFIGAEAANNRKYHENGVLFEHGGNGLITGMRIEILTSARDQIDYATPATVTALNAFANSMYGVMSIGDRDLSKILVREYLPTVIADTGMIQHNPQNPMNHDNVKRFAGGGIMLNKDTLFKLRFDALYGYTTAAALNAFKLRATVFGRTIIPK